MRISDWSSDVCSSDLQHPDAPVAAHPECPPYIVDHADYVGSTSGILQFAKTFPGDTLIVATEPHIIHQMEKELPEKTFIGAPGDAGTRSEERRVGKECVQTGRSRWSRYH